MTARRLVAAVAIMIAAGVLLFTAGFGIYFAISTASDGIGGGDERRTFTAAVIEASALPAGVAFLIAGTGVWQRTPRAFRAVLSGIGLMLIPLIAALLFGADRYLAPIGLLLGLVLPLALLGLAAAYWLRTHEGGTPTTAESTPHPVVAFPHRKRRIASFIIALLATVPLVPLVFFLAAVSFDPLEANDEPEPGAGIAIIIFGIGMVALVIAAARALVRPPRSMMPFVGVAACFALAGIVAVGAGSFDEGVVVPILGSLLSLFLGWLSRVPEDRGDSWSDRQAL